ncbi:hypothetical protein [Rhodopila sp.]|uniref:hypothetical protein n=1 Tax=Rhodopila sp. TaxID=2480087 RepID=UPI003D0F7841
MLNGILRGKKRGTGMESVRLLEEFNGSEDTLTATVLERLFYLPDETVSAILFSQEIWASVAMIPPTPVENVLFWPWQTEAGEQAVEPDVIVEFTDRVLVVEAKRNDFVRQQKPDQLAREYARASMQFPGKQVWLLAVGGLQDGRLTTLIALRSKLLAELEQTAPSLLDQDVRFAAVHWHKLFSVICDVTADKYVYRRLINDIRVGLILHGINVEPLSWMKELTLPRWRAVAGGITSPPAAFIPKWVTTLARLQPITSAASVFLPQERE